MIRRNFEAPSWWTEFRRCCDRLGVKRLSDTQWAMARSIVRQPKWPSPLQAAEQIKAARR
jgi:hypothetical protein